MDQIQKGALRLELDQEIDVAVDRCLVSRNRTEHCDRTGVVWLEQRPNLVAAGIDQ